MDNASLNGDPQEDVYMTQPSDFDSTFPHVICKLHRVIYGLKQAPRSWLQKLSSTIHIFGFLSTKSDNSLFVQFMSSYTIFVLIYVDDIISQAPLSMRFKILSQNLDRVLLSKT